IVAAIIWYLIRKATGYEVGIVAILVGFLIGGAVRKGSGNRGGWVYQLMAVLLTYGCISASLLSDTFKQIGEAFKESRARHHVSATQHSSTQIASTQAASDIDPE